MLNPLPNLLDSLTRNTASIDRRLSSPIEFSIAFPLSDSPLFKDVVIADFETEKMSGAIVLREAQIHQAPKESRRIPFRSPRSLPSMRTPPSDLFQFSQPKGPQSSSPAIEHPPSSALLTPSLSPPPRPPTPARVSSNAVTLPPIGYERPHREDSFNSNIRQGTTPIAIPIPVLAPPPPSVPLTTTTRKSSFQGHATPAAGLPKFLYVLAANKRKNPHAPSLVSKFNPLRDHVPACAWASRTFPLTSARFRTPLSLLPLRSRSECDWATSDGRRSKENYLKKTFLHCHACRWDTLGKKLLVVNYMFRQFHVVDIPVSLEPTADDDLDAMEIDDDDLLDSPMLEDCDDFDDFGHSVDADGALIHGPPGIEMSNLSLF